MPHGITAPRPRILLAEEQAAARDLMKLVLGRLDYRIETFASGGSVLAQAQRDPADLILLSTTLPDMPEASLIGALRQLPGLDQVPIVAIHQGGSEVRQACMAAGAAACLSRPLEIERLLRLIERLVRRRAPAGAPAHEPVLDLDRLRQFTDGDDQLEGELYALFLSTTEVYLREMREALEEGRAWTSIAHALKGASANLGAPRIASLALAAERSEPSRDQLDAIERAVDEMRGFLDRRGAT
jgi:CheY-like chemotaxis protein/HPt (histidine-containing phosphotransfer) domain-containing protein